RSVRQHKACNSILDNIRQSANWRNRDRRIVIVSQRNYRTTSGGAVRQHNEIGSFKISGGLILCYVPENKLNAPINSQLLDLFLKHLRVIPTLAHYGQVPVISIHSCQSRKQAIQTLIPPHKTEEEKLDVR